MNVPMIPAKLRMPFRFDSGALLRDVARIEDAEWERHFNTGVYSGDWSGVALRKNRDTVGLYPDPHRGEFFVDTPLLEHSAAVREVLETFACETTAVRFLRLGPGAIIGKHRDYGLDLESGEARMHVTVQTNDRVTFRVDSEPVPMFAGDCWYIDVSRPHSVENLGTSARIHLVVDCKINDWLEELLITTARNAGFRS